LAESGAGDEVIRDMAGHVSKEMLKHYSHIRTQAKRHAVNALVSKPVVTEPSAAPEKTKENSATVPQDLLQVIALKQGIRSN
jgi:hypothetical protein